MDERSVLLAQMEALADDLTRAARAIDVEQIDPSLREAVRVRFGKLIGGQQSALKHARKQAEADMPLDLCWAAYRAIREDCTPIFRECLAFLEGALVRSAGLDSGICRIADALLDDLSRLTEIRWARLTILAESEFFAQMAEIIRLRFPEFSIWNLPIVGHEFGHLVAQELRVRRPDGGYRYPFQEILQREARQDPQRVPFLRELFSDLFGVYALGPAFAYNCILLRFDPGRAHWDGREHPSEAKRVHFALGALKKLDKADGRRLRRYQGVIGHLSDLWQRSLAAAGQPEELEPAVAAQLDDWLDELYDLIDRELRAVQYRGWSRALRLSGELASRRDVTEMVDDEDTVSDVLNAAWLCRSEQWDEGSYEVEKIGERAVSLGHEMIRRRGERR